MRRLLILASAIVFFDVAFYAAITPLLPGYVDDLGLSKAQAGVLTASYAVGTLVNSLPAGFVATRLGPRRTVVTGLLLLTGSSVVFGFADSFVVLTAARFVQGVSGAYTWTGALTWLVTAADDDKRGAVIGTALGSAVAGAMLGPAMGALASAIGTAAVFGAVAAVTLVFAFAASRLPDATEPGTARAAEVFRAFRGRTIVLAASMVAVPSLMFGLEGVLVPLRIDDLGGGAPLIALGFVLGAAFESMLSPLIGRYSDRAGRIRPYIAGMAVCALGVLLIPAAHASGVVAFASVALAVGAGFCFTPATAILTSAAEDVDLHQGFAAALMNMAWAGGQVFGAVAGGAAAEAFGYAVPCIAMSALLATFGVLAWGGRLTTPAMARA